MNSIPQYVCTLYVHHLSKCDRSGKWEMQDAADLCAQSIDRGCTVHAGGVGASLITRRKPGLTSRL